MNRLHASTARMAPSFSSTGLTPRSKPPAPQRPPPAGPGATELGVAADAVSAESDALFMAWLREVMRLVSLPMPRVRSASMSIRPGSGPPRYGLKEHRSPVYLEGVRLRPVVVGVIIPA